VLLLLVLLLVLVLLVLLPPLLSLLVVALLLLLTLSQHRVVMLCFVVVTRRECVCGCSRSKTHQSYCTTTTNGWCAAKPFLFPHLPALGSSSQRRSDARLSLCNSSNSTAPADNTTCQ
jgi:hypothetical protein